MGNFRQKQRVAGCSESKLKYLWSNWIKKSEEVQKTEADFARLTSADLTGSLFAVLDQYLARFPELHEAKSGTWSPTGSQDVVQTDSGKETERTSEIAENGNKSERVCECVQETDADEPALSASLTPPPPAAQPSPNIYFFPHFILVCLSLPSCGLTDINNIVVSVQDEG
eukprot:superscaffoldBa00003881_g17886